MVTNILLLTNTEAVRLVKSPMTASSTRGRGSSPPARQLPMPTKAKAKLLSERRAPTINVVVVTKVTPKALMRMRTRTRTRMRNLFTVPLTETMREMLRALPLMTTLA